jgi:hypothetical protein
MVSRKNLFLYEQNYFAYPLGNPKIIIIPLRLKNINMSDGPFVLVVLNEAITVSMFPIEYKRKIKKELHNEIRAIVH